MKEISIPYHLLIPTLLSVGALILVLRSKKKIVSKRGDAFYFSVAAFLLIYLFVVGRSLYDDIYYQWALNKYDLDKDGFFGSPTETTAEQQRAMQRLTNDVGRNVSFVTGFLFSGIVSLLLYFTIKVYKKIKGST